MTIVFRYVRLITARYTWPRNSEAILNLSQRSLDEGFVISPVNPVYYTMKYASLSQYIMLHGTGAADYTLASQYCDH